MPGPRTYSDLIILRTTDGAGFPYITQEAPDGLIIDRLRGAWCVPKRNPYSFRFGEVDATAYAHANCVLGVYRLGSFVHMQTLYTHMREAHWRVMHRTP